MNSILNSVYSASMSASYYRRRSALRVVTVDSVRTLLFSLLRCCVTLCEDGAALIL